MLFNPFADVDHLFNLIVLVLGDHLEWPEQLSRRNLKVLLVLVDLLQRNEHCSRLIAPVAFRNLVSSHRLSSEHHLCAWDFQAVLQMLLDLFIAPSKHWANSEIIQSPPFGKLRHLVYDSRLDPVFVSE